MVATKKSQSIIRTLAESLTLRTGLAVVVSSDSNGIPYLILGTSTAGQQCAFIRVKQDYDPALETDGIGNVQRRFTPHVMQIVVEAGVSGTGGAGDPLILTVANWAKVLKDALQYETRVEVYEAANTTALTLANATTAIAAANLKVSLDSLFQPMLSTI